MEGGSSTFAMLVLSGVAAISVAGCAVLFVWSRLRNGRTEAALRDAELRGEYIVNTARDGILIIDETGIIQSFNPAAEQMFGYAAAEAVGLNVAELIPSPDRRRNRRAVTQPAPGRELLGRRKNGSEFPVDMMLSAAPMPGGRCYSAFVRDASERRKSEEALARERNFITAVLDNAGALCAVLDHDGRIIRFNRACEELTDYSQGEIKGRFLWDVVALPEDSQRVEEEVRGVLKGGFPARSESIWVTRRNSRRLVAWTHTVLADSFGRLEYLVSIGADITEKRALENQLAHARRMEAVGRLAGGIAHDFNNLLTAITGYSELVLHTLGEHDPVRKDIEEIRKAGERASALTRQLLAFSRKQVLMTRVFDLNAVVLDMEHMLRRLVGEAIELEVALCAAPAWIHADPSQMGQVLLNLVVNARDAISTGGAIHVATAHVTLDSPLTLPEQTVQPGSYVEFRVSDTGCGMDPETMAHAFEPFFTTKDSGRGTGLGLSTVYGIVSQSGGAISVSSELGDGSTFRVYLPESPTPDDGAQRAGTAGQKTSAS